MSATFHTIVVGCDGDRRGRSAVALAHAVCAATGARLFLVGVHHYPILPPYPDESAPLAEVLTHRLRTIRDELAPGAGIVVEGDAAPARALRRVAVAHGADLVVVGSRPRDAPRRFIDADLAVEALHDTPCAIAVVPDSLAPVARLERIGVGVDDAPGSSVAFALAHALARGAEARLSVRTVVEDATSGWMGAASITASPDALADVLRRRTATARRLVDARLGSCADVRADGDVLTGAPGDQLARAGEQLDLLVLGSRRGDVVHRVALGSTSEQVIRHGACAVLVPARAATTAAMPRRVEVRS